MFGFISALYSENTVAKYNQLSHKVYFEHWVEHLFHSNTDLDLCTSSITEKRTLKKNKYIHYTKNKMMINKSVQIIKAEMITFVMATYCFCS